MQSSWHLLSPHNPRFSSYWGLGAEYDDAGKRRQFRLCTPCSFASHGPVYSQSSQEKGWLSAFGPFGSFNGPVNLIISPPTPLSQIGLSLVSCSWIDQSRQEAKESNQPSSTLLSPRTISIRLSWKWGVGLRDRASESSIKSG